jgi:hypothetical protein
VEKGFANPHTLSFLFPHDDGKYYGVTCCGDGGGPTAQEKEALSMILHPPVQSFFAQRDHPRQERLNQTKLAHTVHIGDYCHTTCRSNIPVYIKREESEKVQIDDVGVDVRIFEVCQVMDEHITPYAVCVADHPCDDTDDEEAVDPNQTDHLTCHNRILDFHWAEDFAGYLASIADSIVGRTEYARNGAASGPTNAYILSMGCMKQRNDGHGSDKMMK